PLLASPWRQKPLQEKATLAVAPKRLCPYTTEGCVQPPLCGFASASRGDDVDSGEKPPSATNKNAFEMTTRHRQFVSPQRVFQKYEEGKMIIDNDTERTERRQEA